MAAALILGAFLTPTRVYADPPLIQNVLRVFETGSRQVASIYSTENRTVVASALATDVGLAVVVSNPAGRVLTAALVSQGTTATLLTTALLADVVSLDPLPIQTAVFGDVAEQRFQVALPTNVTTLAVEFPRDPQYSWTNLPHGVTYRFQLLDAATGVVLEEAAGIRFVPRAPSVPLAQITAPASGARAYPRVAIDFQGGGSDEFDGGLSGDSLTWEREPSLVFGHGNTASAADWEPGTYVVRLTAQNSAWGTAAATVSVSIQLLPPPVVRIQQLANCGRYWPFESVALRGSAFSATELVPLDTSLLEWSLDGGSVFATGPTAVLTELAPGQHSVVLSARSSMSSTGTTSVGIEIFTTSSGVSLERVDRVQHGSSDQPATIWSEGAGHKPAPAYVTDRSLSFVVTNRTGLPLQLSLVHPTTPLTFIVGWEVRDLSGGLLVQAPSGSLGASPALTAATPAGTTTFVHTFWLQTDADWQHFSDLRGLSYRIHSANDVGLVQLDELSVRGREPTTPAVRIEQPEKDSVFAREDPIVLLGSAVDTVDGFVPQSSLRWTLDGQAAGTGLRQAVGSLPQGSHHATLIATNSMNASDIASVSFRVAGNRASVRILEPPDGYRMLPGTTVHFLGSVADGNGVTYPATLLCWQSSREGLLGSGASVDSALIATGSREVSAAITMPDGLVGRAAIQVIVAPFAAPELNIVSPTPGTTMYQDEALGLIGRALDPVLGPYPSPALAWTSTLSGSLGHGTELQAQSLRPGDDTLRLAVRASDGQTYAVTTSIRILPVVSKVEIVAPVSESMVAPGSPTIFAASLGPAGALQRGAYQYLWRSSQQGTLATTASFTTTSLVPGVHHLTVEAVSDRGPVLTSACQLTVSSGPLVTQISRVGPKGARLPVSSVVARPTTGVCSMENTTRVEFVLQNDAAQDITVSVGALTSSNLWCTRVAVRQSVRSTQAMAMCTVLPGEWTLHGCVIPLSGQLPSPVLVLDLCSSLSASEVATSQTLMLQADGVRSWGVLAALQIRRAPEMYFTDVTRWRRGASGLGASIYDLDRFMIGAGYCSDGALGFSLRRQTTPDAVTDRVSFDLSAGLEGIFGAARVVVATSGVVVSERSLTSTTSSSRSFWVDLPPSPAALSVVLTAASSQAACYATGAMQVFLGRNGDVVASLRGPAIVGSVSAGV
ncbi:MAG: hypothetical protein HY303_17610 [Candidatus Wallbacteria bacterium]|nr:hypothetical protein [Candidatus Wallbacteria bacterium]